MRSSYMAVRWSAYSSPPAAGDQVVRADERSAPRTKALGGG